MKKKIILFIILIFVTTLVSAADAYFFELVKKGNPGEIQNAINKGADVNARDQIIGSTPLMYAAQYNPNPDVIQLLINNGADANLKDNEGKTALDYAEDNPKIKGTKVYWRLNDLRYK